ncbi:MAG: phosphoribosyl-AMP cyclohydrolase [Archaeoglobaceae archaeon]|nr:phosphoribosyl-AMP cyclohydrolase [Archaeoglobaceae archaeon]MDW7990368.1 phosphoribosyl-AMP cyclohydrolase [Archaeoglobaceae archaeon]
MELSKLKFKDGIIPVVTQEVKTKEVLMLAYANEEALKRTIETGYAHYWSRSRKKIWMKGESSGNTQRIVEIRVDCDYDSLLYIVEQRGNACHTGNRSCFFRRLGDEDSR